MRKLLALLLIVTIACDTISDVAEILNEYEIEIEEVELRNFCDKIQILYKRIAKTFNDVNQKYNIEQYLDSAANYGKMFVKEFCNKNNIEICLKKLK